eukprot:scaffold846_cov252-Pinguiococcus_pyrenoidosus.AAC.36
MATEGDFEVVTPLTGEQTAPSAQAEAPVALSPPSPTLSSAVQKVPAHLQVTKGADRRSMDDLHRYSAVHFLCAFMADEMIDY